MNTGSRRLYQNVARNSSDPSRWMPTDTDVRLLKRGTGSGALTEWELVVQQRVAGALRQVLTGGQTRFELPHPAAQLGMMANVTVAVAEVREGDYQADEIVVDIVPEPRHAGSELFWLAIVRVLTTINPPQQSWDRYKDSYSNIAEPGHWSSRVNELADLVERGTSRNPYRDK